MATKPHQILSPHQLDKSAQGPYRLPMQTPADHDAYIAGAVEPLRPLLINLRAQLSNALPDVEELIT